MPRTTQTARKSSRASSSSDDDNNNTPTRPTKKRKTSTTRTGSRCDDQREDLDYLVQDHAKRRQDLLQAQGTEMVQLKKKQQEETLALDAMFADEKRSVVVEAMCFSCGSEVESIDKALWGHSSVCCGCQELRKCDECTWPTQCANVEQHGWCTYCEKDAQICCHCEGCHACRDPGVGCCKRNMMEGSYDTWSEESW